MADLFLSFAIIVLWVAVVVLHKRINSIEKKLYVDENFE